MDCLSFNSALLIYLTAVSVSDALPVEVQEVAETSSAAGGGNLSSTSNLFEGDIVLSGDAKLSFARNGFPWDVRRWRKNLLGFVAVPYKISDDYSMEDKQLIRSALSEIENVSCVRFRPAEASDSDYIHIVSAIGCSSLIGRQGGRQIITLASSRFRSNCMEKGSIIHEVLHALGFYHMQSSLDRDQYLRVNYENIKSGMESNFFKYQTTRFETEYDIRSIMHYGSHFFSKNGRPTLEPLDKSTPLSALGQRKKMTSGDVERLNAMYKCSEFL